MNRQGREGVGGRSYARQPAAITDVITSLCLSVSARDCPLAACTAAEQACLEDVAAALWPVHMLWSTPAGAPPPATCAVPGSA